MDSVDELMGCCRSISVKRQFVDEVFGHIDDDNDGVVTKEMFTAFLDRKVVSLLKYIITEVLLDFRETVWRLCPAVLFCSINRDTWT